MRRVPHTASLSVEHMGSFDEALLCIVFCSKKTSFVEMMTVGHIRCFCQCPSVAIPLCSILSWIVS